MDSLEETPCFEAADAAREISTCCPARPTLSGMDRRTNPDRDALVDLLAAGALAIAAERPWEQVSLRDLAAKAQVGLAACARHGVSFISISDRLDQILDEAMLACEPADSQSVRDTLFEVVMARFDAMECERAAWLSIIAADGAVPSARLARMAMRARAAAWALEAAGAAKPGGRGAFRIAGLARLLAKVEAAWVLDGPDLSRTMATLDQGLREAEEWLGRAAGLGDFWRGRTGQPDSGNVRSN